MFQMPDFGFGQDEVDAGKADREQKVGAVNTLSVTGETNMTVGDVGKIVTLSIEVPELYPAANVTSLERQERFVSLMNKLTSARGRTFNGKSIMFDIYMMMDLIQQISQRLRNVMRELRRLENTTIYANIKAQAEIQRESAFAGLVAGAVMCGVQVVVVVVGMGYQLKAANGFAGKGNMMKTAANVENMAAAGSGPGGKPLSANPKFNTVSDELNLGSYEEVNGSSAKADGYAQRVQDAKAEYIAAQTKYNEAQQVVANGGELPQGTSLKQLKANAEQAGLKYEARVAEQLDYAHANPDSVNITEIKTQISADAKDLRKMAIHGVTSDLQQVGGSSAIKGIIIQQIGMAVGQFLQQIASSIRELISAKGTELQAEQKLTEEQFDQIKDLFALQQQVIEKAIQIFASVIQKESSVIEQIFQHI